MTCENLSISPSRALVVLAAMLTLLVGLSACGGGSSPSEPVTQIANGPGSSNENGGSGGTNETSGGSTGGGSPGGGSTGGGGTTSTTGDSTGQLEISMRDAPIDDVSELWIYVSGLKVKPAGEPVVRVETNTGLYNLLALTDGVTADLAIVEVPAGTYQFIEILLDQDESYVVEAATGERQPLQIASGKAKINGGPFEVHGDGATFVLFDFDAEKSLKQKGNGDWQLKPFVSIVRVTEDDGAG